MTVRTSSRPSTTEYAEYYGLYIDRVPNGDILELLENQIAESTGMLAVQRKVSSSKRGARFDSFCQDKSLGL